jgi:flagellar hook protein FlgE
MSIQTALSGLLTEQTALDTASNDLANADTTAFKSQTALFKDIYPANESNVAGIGASTEEIESNFSQGDVQSTGNPLDAAIQGSGYFVTQQDGAQEYTRDGAFQLTTTGQLVTASGASVLGFAQNANGTLAGTLSSLSVNTGSIAASATTKLGLELNLDSSSTAIPATTAFDPQNAASYNSSTSVTAYDSLGDGNNLQLFFAQTTPAPGAASTWTVYSQTAAQASAETAAVAAGSPNPAAGNYTTVGNLNFNSTGALTNVPPTAIIDVAGTNGAAVTPVTLNFAGTTLGAQSFGVASVTNNGYAPGTYSGISISSAGQIVASYSNGQTVNAGTLGIANFINQQGLTPVSGNLYAASSTSGSPVVNTPGVGQAGTISGGNLEQSNASTSSLLVQLIQYQQAYQADTSVLQTEQQDSQRLVQI